MTKNPLNMYIPEWLEKIQSNISNFRLEEHSDSEKLEFIISQYHLISLIVRALDGTVFFTGAKPINKE